MGKHRQSVEERYRRVLALIDLSEQVVRDSKLMADDEKRDYFGDYEASREDARSHAEQGNASYLRQLEDEILTPWNETYDADSEAFWRRAAERGLGLGREDHLQNILDRGRIANFEEYNLVADSIVLWQQEGRIDQEEAKRLGEMVGAFEARRG